LKHALLTTPEDADAAGFAAGGDTAKLLVNRPGAGGGS